MDLIWDIYAIYVAIKLSPVLLLLKAPYSYESSFERDDEDLLINWSKRWKNYIINRKVSSLQFIEDNSWTF